MMPRKSVLVTMVLLVVVGTPLSPLSRAGQADRDAIRDSLKQYWESIESLAFRSEEFELDERGLPKKKGFTRFDIALAADGRRATVVTAVRPEGEQVIANVREDGRHRFVVEAVPGRPDVPDTIHVSNQKNTRNEYRDPSIPLSQPETVITPAGRPLYSYIDAKSTWEGPTKEGYMLLGFDERKMHFQCELDPKHGWLPRRIVTEGVSELIITDFALENGHFFPVSGQFTDLFKTANNRSGFRVSNLHINRPLGKTTFTPPAPVDGTLVVDRVSRKGTVKGGLEARARLTGQENGVSDGASSLASPLTASVEPEGFAWARAFFVTTAVSLVALGIILIRRARA